MNRQSINILFVSALAVSVLSGCVSNPPARMGMVKQEGTGLMFGSTVGSTLVTDASMHKNRKLKVRIRNTSGDTSFDLKRFRGQIEQAYESVGYTPTQGGDFGIMVNVNVSYSGQVQTNLSSEYSFLGAAAGGVAGYRSKATAGTAVGVIAGATLGNIVGSYVTDDTYIIISRVSIAFVKDLKKRDGRTVTFSRSVPGHVEDEEDKEERLTRRKFRKVFKTGIAVYAGGRMVKQSQISEQVRQRFVRIISDII